MSDFGLQGGGAHCLHSGYDYTTTHGTSVATHASANTKGSWVEILSAANNIQESSELYVYFVTEGAITHAGHLIDLAVGAASSEQVLIANMMHRTSAVNQGVSSDRWHFPIKIPAGVRISLRSQCSVGGVEFFGYIQRVPSAFSMGSGLSQVITIGAETADSSGTFVDSPSANNLGSWTEMTSSLSESIKGFLTAQDPLAPSWSSNIQVTYQVGVGAAASEQIIYSGNSHVQHSGEGSNGEVSQFIPVGIVAGTRISIRSQASQTNGDADLDFILYGVR